MILDRAVDFAHLLVSRLVLQDRQAIDATAGNGHDTLFLAKQVGNKGKVFAFDIQEKALQGTAEKLRSEKASIGDNVELIKAGHENMDKYIEGEVGAIMFNLGYLPGGDRSIITRPETTFQAVKQALSLLEVGGLITLVCYPGHPGGEQERDKVREMVESLSPKSFQVIHYEFINQANPPPELFAVEKISECREL